MTESAYIHIPFCKSRCHYCSFVSGCDFDKKTGYLYSLLKEIDYYYRGETLKTFYIGGGTPSVLGLNEIEKLVKKFSYDEICEKTIEVNPNDINEDYIKGLKELGFNRISMGAQSFDDKILNLIGRRHKADEIYKAVELAQQTGFKNISLDLIYGLPTQTIKGFEYDIKEALCLNLQHISLYGLKIEENCYFYNNLPDNLPNDDTQADMYIMAGELTSQYGFNHYEISNYSKIGYESKHNTNYWKCGEYYGFGLSAHGYVDGVRYSNFIDMGKYLESPASHEYGKFLTKDEMLEERIFLGLRLKEGVNTEEINSEFGIDFDKKYRKVLDKYLSTGHIEQTSNGYRLSDNKETNGFLLSNIILAEFLG